MSSKYNRDMPSCYIVDMFSRYTVDISSKYNRDMPSCYIVDMFSRYTVGNGHVFQAFH
jgi:hypothetical protein